MLLYSRLELSHAEVKFLIEDDVPSIHARLALRSGAQVELRCVHPRPPAPQEADRSTERDAELLIVGRALKKLARPAIVIGDLNDVAWSRTSAMFQNVSGLLDPRVGRGFYTTFNAKWPIVRFPLDHAFHTRHFRLIEFRRLPRWGSDHFPVYVKLSFEPDAEAEQEKPQASPDEKQEAQEKISEAGE
jgi:endonuclease/exonuclease/phosphatase (EEP) superfamily protein YafD